MDHLRDFGRFPWFVALELNNTYTPDKFFSWNSSPPCHPVDMNVRLGEFSRLPYLLLTETRFHSSAKSVHAFCTDPLWRFLHSTIQELNYERSVTNEIACLRILSHPGIARLISTFRWRDGAYLVLEYASRGDLHSHVKEHGSLSETSTRIVLCSVIFSVLQFDRTAAMRKLIGIHKLQITSVYIVYIRYERFLHKSDRETFFLMKFSIM